MKLARMVVLTGFVIGVVSKNMDPAAATDLPVEVTAKLNELAVEYRPSSVGRQLILWLNN